MGSVRRDQKARVEEVLGQPLRAILLDFTYRRRLSQRQIASLLEVPEGTVASWFQREGIQANQLAALKASEMLGTNETTQAAEVAS